jgi:hypothetical protein
MGCNHKGEFPDCKGCKYDDCTGYPSSEERKAWRDKRVKRALNYMDKHGIKFSETKTPNIVLVDYHIQKFRFSLNHFKICIDNNWIDKSKRILNQGTKLKFGRYKDRRLKEVSDFNYINWLLRGTDIMIHPDCFKKEKTSLSP